MLQAEQGHSWRNSPRIQGKTHRRWSNKGQGLGGRGG